MSIPILMRGLRQHALLLLVVLGAVMVFEVLVVSVVAAMDSGAGLRTLLTAVLPSEMQTLVFEQFGVASFPSAVAFGFQHPLVLVAAMAVVIVVGTVPARERESGFLDLILARPVPRARYLAASLGLIVLATLLIPLALLLAVVVGLRFVDGTGELPWTHYTPSAAALAPLLLVVGAYTLLASSIARRRGVASGWAVALTLSFYWLDFMAGFWEVLRPVRWLSPFTYYDPVRAAVGTGLGWRDPLVLLGSALLLTIAAFVTFERQEI